MCHAMQALNNKWMAEMFFCPVLHEACQLSLGEILNVPWEKRKKNFNDKNSGEDFSKNFYSNSLFEGLN